MESNNSPPPRSLQRFSLRTMMLLITLFATAMGIYHGYIVPFQLEESAGLALNEKGAKLNWEPARPVWLRSSIRYFFPHMPLRHCVAVHAERSQIEDDDLRLLRRMPHVERLYLARTRISDEGLKNLATLSQLKRLSLWSTPITDEGIKHLRTLHDLEALDIRVREWFGVFGTRIGSDWGFYPATTDRQEKPKLTCRSLDHLSELTKLQRLRFSFVVDDQAIAVLASFPDVRIDWLVARNVSESGFEHLASFEKLEILHVSGGDAGSGGLTHLASLPGLVKLRLDSVQIGPDGWKGLSDSASLEELSLHGPGIDDAAMRHLAKIQGLKRVSFSGPRITDAGVAHLAGAKQLEAVDLMRAGGITADCIRHLAGLPTIRELRIDEPLDDEAVELLAGMPQLTTLSGGETLMYLTDAGLSHLAHLPCNRVNVLDAVRGKNVPGIDVPAGSGRMTDAGVQQIWQTGRVLRVQLLGSYITVGAISRVWKKTRLQEIVIRSVSPFAEFFTGPIQDCTEASVGRFVLRLQMNNSTPRGPRHLAIHFDQFGGCDLSVLRFLPDVEMLRIAPDMVGSSPEAGWDNLRFMKKLRWLETSVRSERSRLDRKGIARLGELKDLTSLKCALADQFPVDDFAPLSKLTNLVSLELHCGSLTPEHFAMIAEMKSLRILRIYSRGASLTDQDGLLHLAALPQLEELSIYETSDAGIAHLAKVPGLKRLSATGNDVTDQSFQHLDRFPSLSHVDVRSTNTSDEQLHRFVREHPRIHVRQDRPRRPRN